MLKNSIVYSEKKRLKNDTKLFYTLFETSLEIVKEFRKFKAGA